MAQEVKVFAAKSEDMCWVSFTGPTWYKERTDFHRLFSGVHMYTAALTHTCTH